jgi:uncharacterized membrane protein
MRTALACRVLFLPDSGAMLPPQEKQSVESSISRATGSGFELVGVAVLIAGALASIVICVATLLRGGAPRDAYAALREALGRAILVGLEFLVAADIVRSIAIQPTFQSVGVLALIVAVRTFLSWSLEVEINGRWPWTRPCPSTSQAEEAERL